MKFGFRTPSLTKKISARTSLKRIVRSKIRVPRGMGVITSPKRAIYNKIYRRTSFGLNGIGSGVFKSSRRPNTGVLSALGYLILICILIVIWPIGLLVLSYFVYKFFKRKETSLANQQKPQIIKSAILPTKPIDSDLEKRSVDS